MKKLINFYFFMIMTNLVLSYIKTHNLVLRTLITNPLLVFSNYFTFLGVIVFFPYFMVSFGIDYNPEWGFITEDAYYQLSTFLIQNDYLFFLALFLSIGYSINCLIDFYLPHDHNKI